MDILKKKEKKKEPKFIKPETQKVTARATELDKNRKT